MFVIFFYTVLKPMNLSLSYDTVYYYVGSTNV